MGDSEANSRLRYRQDSESVAPLASFAEFAEQTNATAVRIEPGDDARALLPRLDQLSLIEIAFPAFRDGRGYSSARILREAGYSGELRAQGDVLVDQIAYMRRCGFDSFAPSAPLDQAVVDASLSRYDYAYQVTSTPAWKLRHG